MKILKFDYYQIWLLPAIRAVEIAECVGKCVECVGKCFLLVIMIKQVKSSRQISLYQRVNQY